MKPEQVDVIRPLDSIFEGRDEELATLRSALAAAGDDVGGVVVVRGEAGIGKTVLLARALEQARAEGWHFLHLRPDELGYRIRYGALGHAISVAIGTRSPAAREAATRLASALDSGAERSLDEVHALAARFFAALRADAPTILAIDDLPLVDEDTLVLVGSLLRRTAEHPLVLVGTVRRPDTRQVSSTLTRLLERADAEGVLRTVELGPLDEQGITALLLALLAQPPDAALVGYVNQQSGGSPFFAVHIVLNLVESGAVTIDESSSRLAGPIPRMSADRRGALLHRVLRVGPDARRVGRAVALLGSLPLHRLDLVAELTALSLTGVEEGFDLLVECGILRPAGDDTYRFPHQLVREALYAELGPAERQRWHRVVGARLAESARYRADELEIATHVQETAEYGDDEAIQALYRAAEIACHAAPRTSIHWYRRALAIAPDDHPAHAEISARLARALFIAGRPAEAVDEGRKALPRMPVDSGRAKLATLVIEALSMKLSDVDAAVDVIETELAAGTSSLRLQAQRAYALAATGRLDEADEAAQAVLADIDTVAATERVNVLLDLLHMGNEARFGSVPGILARLEAAASGAVPTARLSGLLALSYGYATRGDTAACARAIAQTEALLAELDWPLYRPNLLVVRAQNAANLGHWDEAIALAEDAKADLEEAGSLALVSFQSCQQAALLANRGKFAAARQALEPEPPPHPIAMAGYASARAEVEMLSGDLPAALTHLLAHLDDPRMPPHIRVGLVIRAAEVEWERGDADAALARLSAIESSTPDELGFPFFVRASTVRGSASGDADLLREAMTVADEHELALLQGRTRLALGTMGVDPLEHLQAAVGFFRRLGAEPWLRRATTALRDRGMPVPRQRAKSSSLLTPTEEQIVRLVQLGRSNPDIARTVHLSVKTVERYLSRVYTKTGCSSRFDLARAVDRGLID